MKSFLKNLWYDYIIEETVEQDEQEKQLIKELTRTENQFRSKINDKLRNELEEYDRIVCTMGSISEKNAFIKGVKFATRFIFEALE